MALFLGTHVHDLYRAGSLSTTSFVTWVVVLVLYVLSIVGGRLYTGMHGFLDVSVGVILGIIAWVLQRLAMPEVERWMIRSGWSGASSFPFPRLNFTLIRYLRSSPDRDASLSPPCQPTSITR